MRKKWKRSVYEEDEGELDEGELSIEGKIEKKYNKCSNKNGTLAYIMR